MTGDVSETAAHKCRSNADHSHFSCVCGMRTVSGGVFFVVFFCAMSSQMRAGFLMTHSLISLRTVCPPPPPAPPFHLRSGQLSAWTPSPSSHLSCTSSNFPSASSPLPRCRPIGCRAGRKKVCYPHPHPPPPTLSIFKFAVFIVIRRPLRERDDAAAPMLFAPPTSNGMKTAKEAKGERRCGESHAAPGNRALEK